jgi:hypothetical protein
MAFKEVSGLIPLFSAKGGKPQGLIPYIIT